MHRTLKLSRRLIILASLVGIAVCIIYLLNFTADNPTGRRYSSSLVTITGKPGNIGDSGEDVLAKDLKLPNNNRAGQQKCICDHDQVSSPSGCSTCILYGEFPSVDNFERPDFVGKGFIAESKNVAELNTYTQLKGYAEAARYKGLKLWVFVRVDTKVDSRYDDLVEGTGGDIVYYFAVPGYEDPTDRRSKIGLVFFVPALAGTAALEVRTWRKPRLAHQHQAQKAAAAVDDLEAFANRIRVRSHVVTDKENPPQS